MATYTDNYNMTKPTMAESADIRTINGNMDTIDEIMHSTQISMADAFDSTKSYVIRDKVMYELQLYQCIHPHTGPWDAGNWVRVNAAETGGNYVEITPTYQSGLKVAETNIDGDQDEIDVPYFGGATAQQNGTGGAVPAPTSSDVGKFLSSNGGWETPSGGGGGTTVVPNPVGEPAEDLETVQIGNIIYNIPGNGGGAGSSYKNLISQSITATGTYTLSESIEDFDFIVVEMGYLVSGSGNPVVGSTWANVNNLKNNYNSGDYSIWVDGGNNDRSSSLSFTDATTISVTKASDSDAIVGIYGVKLGGGGGSDKELIYTLEQGQRWESFSNPNSGSPLIIEACGGGGVIARVEVDVSKLPSREGGDNYLTVCQIQNAQGKNVNMATNNNNDTIYISTSATYSSAMYVKVYESVGGGSGSGGGYSETDLFVNTGSTNPASIVMADSIQNYDEIVFCVTRNAYGNTYKLQFRYLPTELALGDVIQCWCWGPNNEYFSYQLTAYDTFSNMAQGNALLCNKIKGIKH